MKLMKYLIKQPLLLAGGLLLLASCADSSKKDMAVKQSEPVAGKQKGQFAFYKDINIRPGINFEVVSWGKGVDSVGGYLILMSDSLKSNYKSFSNERNGIITDAWNMDLDNDGNPEIYIELLSKKNVHDLNVFEYSDGNFNKITFPALSDRAKKTYGGNDKFVIKNGDLFRTYPIVNSKDSTEKDGSLKTLQYRLGGNSFSISEIKE